MALQRGKKRRRTRTSRDRTEAAPEPLVEPEAPRTSARRRRQTKPLAERSPIPPTLWAVGIVIAGIFFTVDLHYQIAYKALLLVGYILAAAGQGFIAFRIYRARGGWR